MSYKNVQHFGDGLTFSKEPSYQLEMESFYREFFGTVGRRVTIKRISEIDEQKKGYDVVVQLDNDTWFRVEEKRDRYAHTGNIVLELWSDINKKRGWLYTSRADFIAYHFDGTGITHMLPTAPLRKAWVDKELEWRDTYRVMTRDNRGWVTEFILIPLNVLWEAMRDTMVHNHIADQGERW
jgi:hypothetical protein